MPDGSRTRQVVILRKKYLAQFFNVRLQDNSDNDNDNDDDNDDDDGKDNDNDDENNDNNASCGDGNSLERHSPSKRLISRSDLRLRMGLVIMIYYVVPLLHHKSMFLAAGKAAASQKAFITGIFILS